MSQMTAGRTHQGDEDDVPPVPRQQLPQDDVPEAPDEQVPDVAAHDVPEPPDPAVPPVEPQPDDAQADDAHP